MPKAIVMDEFHITVYVPRGLTEEESRAIRRTLDGASFRGRLLRAVQGVFARYRSLSSTMASLTR
jgi:hypothetical protein